ncbi:MAG: hypothetical protein RLZZ501_2673 [Pseudomonadota bacterium]
MAFVRPFVLALAVCAAAFAAPARAEGFLSAYEDLPLAPGLAEIAGAGVAFDSPNGRIVEAYAHGRVSPAALLRFYADTLPQLGWSRQSDTLYRREAEVLRLAPAAERDGVMVRFSISPE